MSGIWKLTVRGSFSAAHCLREYQGKCERLHGHNYQVRVSVAGRELDPKVQFLVDFGELKALLKEVLASLDHRLLNEVPPFDVLNPSAENLARYIFQEFQRRFDVPRAWVVEAAVAETEMQEAAYSEDKPQA